MPALRHPMTKTPTTDTGQRCIGCNYNLTGITAKRCPECGWKTDIDWNSAAERLPFRNEEAIASLMGGLALFFGILGLIFSVIAIAMISASTPPDRINQFLAWSTLIASLAHLLAFCGLSRDGIRRPSAHVRFVIMLASGGLQVNAAALSTAAAQWHPVIFLIMAFPGGSLLFIVLVTGRRMEQRERFRDFTETKNDLHSDDKH